MKSNTLFKALFAASFGIFCFLPIALFAQSENLAQNLVIDARLSGLYDADYLQRLQTLQPVQLQRLNFYLDHSYEIQNTPEGKTFEATEEVEISDIAVFNIIAFEQTHNLHRDAQSSKLFRIKGTNKLLVLLPESEFVKRFNAARKL